MVWPERAHRLAPDTPMVSESALGGEKCRPQAREGFGGDHGSSSRALRDGLPKGSVRVQDPRLGIPFGVLRRASTARRRGDRSRPGHGARGLGCRANSSRSRSTSSLLGATPRMLLPPYAEGVRQRVERSFPHPAELECPHGVGGLHGRVRDPLPGGLRGDGRRGLPHAQVRDARALVGPARVASPPAHGLVRGQRPLRGLLRRPLDHPYLLRHARELRPCSPWAWG